jgi:hypothetical protein
MPETLSQPMAALERANAKRTEVAKLKAQVRSGELSAAEVITDPPELLRTPTRARSRPFTVAEVLSWQAGWGRKRAERFVRRQLAGISPFVSLHHLTRQRRRLVASKLPKS